MKPIIFVITLLLIMGHSTRVDAQSLRAATLTYWAGSTADIMSSVWPSDRCHELNPTLAWADHKPVALAATTAGLAMGNYYLWRWVGRTYPRVAKWVLLGTGGVRAAAAADNARLCF